MSCTAWPAVVLPRRKAEKARAMEELLPGSACREDLLGTGDRAGQRCRGRETLGLTGPRLRVWTPHSLGCVDGQLCSQGSGWLTAAASFISLHQGWDRRRARSPLQGSSAFAEDAECIPPPAGCTMLHAMCVWPWWDCQPERLQRKAKVRLKNTLRIQGNQNI